MLLVSILLWSIVGVLFVVLLALALPLDLVVQVHAEQDVTYRVQGRPFGGLSPPITLTGRQRQSPEAQAEPKPSRRRSLGGHTGAMVGAAPRLLTGILGAFRIKALTLDGEFGLGDPAQTGQAFGILSPLIYGTSGTSRFRVALRPNFERYCLSGQLAACFRVTPIALAPPILIFLWRVFGPAR